MRRLLLYLSLLGLLGLVDGGATDIGGGGSSGTGAADNQICVGTAANTCVWQELDQCNVTTGKLMFDGTSITCGTDAGAGSGISNVVEDTTPQLGGNLDVNGKSIGDGILELLTFVEDASAINHIEIENQAIGGGPIIRAVGDDTNIDLNLESKGSGTIKMADTIDVTGNVVVSGTVDGRDVATDGTTLDAVEASATADQSDAEIIDGFQTGCSDGEAMLGQASTTCLAISGANTGDETDATIIDSVQTACSDGEALLGQASTTCLAISGSNTGDSDTQLSDAQVIDAFQTGCSDGEAMLGQASTACLAISGANTGDNDEVGTKTTGDLCINDGSSVNCTVNLESELETALDGINVLVETEIDSGSELLALYDDETGTGVPVFSISPTFTGAVITDDIVVDGVLDTGTRETFDDSDATPDVSTGSFWITNTTTFTITDFDGAGRLAGQFISVESAGAITYDCTSSATFECGSVDIVTAAGDLTTWIWDGTTWHLIAFKDQSTDMGTDDGAAGGETNTLGSPDVGSEVDLINSVSKTGTVLNLVSFEADDFTVSSNVVTIDDDSHAHTTTTISGLVDGDVSDTLTASLSTTQAVTVNSTAIATTAYVHLTTRCDIEITLEDPGAAEDGTIGFTNKAITVTEIRGVLIGSSTPSVTWTVRHGTDRSATGAEVVTSGTTTTSVSTGDDVTSFNDATIVANSFVWLETTAKSGTVDEIHVTACYTED